MKRFMKVLVAIIFIVSTFAPTFQTVQADSSLYKLPTIGNAGSSSASSAAFSPNGKYLATSNSRNVLLWNTSSLSLLQEFKAATDSIQNMMFSENGEKLLISAYHRIVQVDVASATQDFEVPTLDTSSVLNATYSQNGDFIYVLKPNHLIIFNKDGTMKDSFSLTNRASNFAYNAKTDEIAISFENGEIIIRQASTGDYVRTITYDGQLADFANVYVQYSPDFKTLYRVYRPKYAGDAPITIATLNVEEQYKETPLHSGKFKYDFYDIYNFAVSPDNQYLLLKGAPSNDRYNYKTIIFELATQTAVAEMSTQNTNLLIMTTDNRRLFTGNTLYNAEQLPKRQLAGIAITPEQTIIGIDDVQTLQASHVFSDGLQQPLNNTDVKWSSSNSNVATFIAGKLQGVSAGEATITATYNNFSATQKIIVRNYVEQPKETDIAPDKVWTVTFNTNVNVQTIKQQTMYVTNAKGEIVPMLYYVAQTNSKSVQLMPVTPYTPGETYTLWVKDVKSSSNVALEQFTKKQFTIK
ncbi:Ig-like domain-containing protein [Caryophanon latum]|uniref:BIG2 domain-containing protein n=1 Tax=Caryophanon latum TaxID=33977 RepID=A0A1C0YVF6_9BACL|nr:Ig-like domain-containing protein [Caryophanon latum]OCS91114.1 hypothetical protein A6K76_10240 [Caryophanon latum]